jgi:hypothetical protein
VHACVSVCSGAEVPQKAPTVSLTHSGLFLYFCPFLSLCYSLTHTHTQSVLCGISLLSATAEPQEAQPRECECVCEWRQHGSTLGHYCAHEWHSEETGTHQHTLGICEAARSFHSLTVSTILLHLCVCVYMCTYVCVDICVFEWCVCMFRSMYGCVCVRE